MGVIRWRGPEKQASDDLDAVARVLLHELIGRFEQGQWWLVVAGGVLDRRRGHGAS
ncbi:hypothetical protein [Streptomyces sp. GC420]|uniref:hypothetical protein n=1 Tax=Streptomyces sp. GC420 TaxID=2697568 RepID=UPI001FB750B3|nr:hypothetical protein [Streptomyces sp. GC420]